MNTKLLLACAAVCVACAAPARQIGLGIDAFNRAVPPGADKTSVFSPLAFEIDCVLFAEASDTIVRGDIADAIGVLTEFDATYAPILGAFGASSASNGLSWASARLFCMSDLSAVSRVYRNRAWAFCDAGLCAWKGRVGGEAFLRTKLDGAMESFSLGDDDGYVDFRFHDVNALTVSPAAGFSPRTVAPGVFRAPSGDRTLPMMTGETVCGLHANRNYSLVRLPLAGGAVFCALLPAEGRTLDDVRSKFNAVRIGEILVEPDMLGVSGTGTFRSRLTLPVIDVTASCDLTAPLAGCKVSLGNLPLLGVKASPHPNVARQSVRFRLAPEAGRAGASAAVRETDASVPVARPVALDRPFLWFVHHPATASILAVGVYTGD